MTDTNGCELLRNIGKIHTTTLGTERIKRNLSLNVTDVVQWCREQIQKPEASITREGKNWYVTAANCRITIHARSYTIITAHRMQEQIKIDA